MTTHDWGNLPLVALRNIIKYLNTDHAMTATSTCRHWRQAIFMYDGYKDILFLKASELYKSIFLCRIHRRCVQRLHIFLDCGNDAKHHIFFQHIIPMFYETGNVKEIVFAGPWCNRLLEAVPLVTLKSATIDRVIDSQCHSLKSVGFVGCDILACQKYSIEEINAKHFSAVCRSFLKTIHIEYTLGKCNPTPFKAIQFVNLDYNQLDQNVLEGLATLQSLTSLSLNITQKSQINQKLNWQILRSCKHRVDVALNIMSVPKSTLSEIMDYVLLPGMPLARLRVFFCDVFIYSLVVHVGTTYKPTIREIVWVDSAKPIRRKPYTKVRNDMEVDNIIHPLIWLCWQCTRLEKLVLHGYWVWQYDLLGMARLRTYTMKQLEVSATSYDSHHDSDTVLPVGTREQEEPVDARFIKQINELLSFEWEPMYWKKLHPGLLYQAKTEDRCKYILKHSIAYKNNWK